MALQPPTARPVSPYLLRPRRSVEQALTERRQPVAVAVETPPEPEPAAVDRVKEATAAD